MNEIKLARELSLRDVPWAPNLGVVGLRFLGGSETTTILYQSSVHVLYTSHCNG